KPIDGETPDGMQFQSRSDGAVVVREPDKGRRVEIKVGQQVDMVTGRIKEPFERPPQAVPAPKSMPSQRGVVPKRARTSSSDRDDRPVDEPAQEQSAAPPEKAPQ